MDHKAMKIPVLPESFLLFGVGRVAHHKSDEESSPRNVLLCPALYVVIFLY